ncbi:hypothetical protein pb186bvf_013556 [Paramecium bursaria]
MIQPDILDLMLHMMRLDFDLGQLRRHNVQIIGRQPRRNPRQNIIEQLRQLKERINNPIEKLRLEIKAKMLEKRWGELYRDLDNCTEEKFRLKCLARVHFKLKKYQESHDCAQKLLEIDQQSFWGHLLVGICKARQAVENDDFEVYKKAEIYFTKAKQILSQNANENPQKNSALRRKTYIYRKLYWYLQREQEIIEVKQRIQEFSDSLDKDNEEHKQALESFSELQYSKVPKCKPIPGHLVCAITQEIMIDPVMSDAGTSFEKKAFREMLFHSQGQLMDPVTRQRISRDMVPNRALKEALEQYLAQNPYAYKYFDGENYKLVTF